MEVQRSEDSFVVQQAFVLRINICGKNRQLLVAAKRQNVKILNQVSLRMTYMIFLQIRIRMFQYERLVFSHSDVIRQKTND